MPASAFGPSPLRKVTPLRIFEQAVEQIRDLIVVGDLKLGQKLPTEQQLSKQLNVSRSSVREALRVLEAEGLVEVRQGSGTYVANEPGIGRTQHEAAHWLEQREEMLEQVLQVRECVEGLAAALAAERAPDSVLAAIHDILARQTRQVGEMVESHQQAYDILAQLDVAFHLAIGSAGGNDIANEIISRILPSFNQTNKAILYASGRMTRMLKEHAAILTAMDAHDAPAAEQAMRHHLARVRAEIIDLKHGRLAEPLDP